MSGEHYNAATPMIVGLEVQRTPEGSLRVSNQVLMERTPSGTLRHWRPENIQVVEDDIEIVEHQPSTKTTRPKAVYLWTEADVQKWLRRHCSDYYNLYWERFHEHDITGRALVRITDNTLVRMGVSHREHREAIWREILKLRLKTDIVEIRDLERRHYYFNYDL